MTMYVCGPTVYGPVHIGHAKTFLVYDLMRKYFTYFKNWKVIFVQNITDVGHMMGDVDEGEDKLQAQANIERVHPMEIADKYIKDMWDGLDALEVKRPNIAPRATGHIVEIIDMVSALLQKGFAYESNGDIYFNVSKFKNYGKLSGNDIKTLKKDARVCSNSRKKDALDFALWKKATPKHIMQWSSPWGKGYPGWHIECSVMSSKYLGIPFDIHGGAIELKFPHHENEIAQSEALWDDFVRFWVHTGMLMIDGQKMGKSLGNFLTIEKALKKYDTKVMRFFILSNHYRKPVDFKQESLKAAQNALEKVDNFIFQLRQKTGNKYNHSLKTLLTALENNFEIAMDDDFNTPVALSHFFTFINKANKEILTQEYNNDNVHEIIDCFQKINKVFQCFVFTEKPKNNIDILEIEKLIQCRSVAQESQDWQLADKIREQLRKMGIKLFDQKNGKTTYKIDY